MPYITDFNANRIISSSTEMREVDDMTLYRRGLPFFNRLELCRLEDYKRFCEGEVELNDVYKSAEKIDRYQFIVEGRAPSYHATADCEYLNSNFRNVKLPEVVQEWDKSCIDEFRAWFRKEVSDFEDDQLIREAIQEEWGIECIVERVNYRNSGSIFKENLQLDQLETRVDSLFQAQRDFYFQHRGILSKYSKKTFLAFREEPIYENDTKMSDDELKAFLRYYHNAYKEPFQYYLKEYFRVKSAKDVEFQEDLLDSLGFVKCSSCYGGGSANGTSNGKNIYARLTGELLLSELDEFLVAKNAKKLCKHPSELVYFESDDEAGCIETYLFCKLMSKPGESAYTPKGHELTIELIMKDHIIYLPASYVCGERKLSIEDLELYNGYLTFIRYSQKNKEIVTTELYPYSYEEKKYFF